MAGLTELTCWKCKCNYAMPTHLYRAAQQNSAISFFCPNGHSAHFPDGPTEEDKLRRERDALKQQQARLYDCIREERERKEAAERRAAAARGQVTKLKNRASAGVCPCCNRSFENLRRHMNSKHPEFSAPESLKVIEGGKVA